MTYDKKAPFKSKRLSSSPLSGAKNSLKLVLPCDCCNRKNSKACGSLFVIDFGDGDVELDGVYLNKKSVERLRKFLFWANENIKTHRHIAGNSGKCIICSK